MFIRKVVAYSALCVKFLDGTALLKKKMFQIFKIVQYDLNFQL